MAFFYDLFTHWSGPPVLGGPCRGRIATGRNRVRQPPRGRLLAAFRSLTCVVTTAPRRAFGPRVIRTRIRPLAGAECAPNSNRGRTAGTVCNQFAPAVGRTQACHAHLASAENRSPETRLKRNLGLVSEGHLTGVGRPVLWMRRSGFRNPAVGLSGLGGPHSTCLGRCAWRSPGYRRERLLDGNRVEVQERPRDEKDDHCLVTFPLILDLSDLECRSSASGVPERAKRCLIAFSVTP